MRFRYSPQGPTEKGHRGEFETALERVSKRGLRQATRGAQTQGEMVAAFQADGLYVCKLGSERRRVFSRLFALDRAAERVTLQAENVPWYPRGWNSWDEGVAWRWIDGADCGYSFGYCWQIEVIARDGCADGIYAEMSILSGGTVTDYSNDTLGSLGPGERGRLDFEHFGEGEGTLSGRITEIDCHDLGFLD